MNYVILIYPYDMRENELAEVASRLMAALKESAEDPITIYSNTKTITVLANGNKEKLSSAIDNALGSSGRFMILSIGNEYAVHGIAAAKSWLIRHNSHTQD